MYKGNINVNDDVIFKKNNNGNGINKTNKNIHNNNETNVIIVINGIIIITTSMRMTTWQCVRSQARQMFLPRIDSNSRQSDHVGNGGVGEWGAQHTNTNRTLMTLSYQ